MTDSQYIATLRVVFNASDELGARLVAYELQDMIGSLLETEDEEGESVDVTQVIPSALSTRVLEPTEVVEQLLRARDLLIRTRIIQCFELAKEIDKTAWILEHRAEESFDLSGYDYGRIFSRADELGVKGR